MPRIVIIGGKLQGTEVAYLGEKAGFEIFLIDKNPNPPAKNLCSEFICADITKENKEIAYLLMTADMILPTLENWDVLEFIVNFCKKNSISNKLAFDWDAYQISSSKLRSDELFHKNNLPAPKYFPQGNFPYFAKPSEDSGSHGVAILNTEKALEDFKEKTSGEFVIQEYIEGPSYSVEVIGEPGNYRTYDLVEIIVDKDYDCNCVSTDHKVNKKIETEIGKIAIKIAQLIKLKGIMDLEVIVNQGEIKILEIDARFPSQTPIAVYHSSGVNYVQELYDLFVGGSFQSELSNDGNYASLIHFLIKGNSFETLGEHIMVEGEPLKYMDGLAKNAIVISDYSQGKTEWRATFIYSADTPYKLRVKSDIIIGDLTKFISNNRKQDG